MATVEGWKDGGIFSWVSQTLGERLVLQLFFSSGFKSRWLHHDDLFYFRGIFLCTEFTSVEYRSVDEVHWGAGPFFGD